MASLSTKRQQHYVSRTIQGSLLRQFATDWLMYFLLLWHGMFFLSLLDVPAPFGNAELPMTFWERYFDFCQGHLHLALCGVLIFPLFFWNALRLSHRIAGPLERFRNALDLLRRGESVKPVTLRRDDLLVDFQRAFNRYLNHLETETRSRGGLPKFVREESDTVSEAATNPLIRELESLKAEIHGATSDSHRSKH